MPDQRPPSVDAVARSLADVGLPHPLLVDAARAAIAAGDPDSARWRAEATAGSLLRDVINATGVLLHTNLGRAPRGAIAQTSTAALRYNNVELDLATGRRGSRSAHAAGLLARAGGAEAALVVNNGASAVLLALAALAAGREVIVSRGQMVEIGGGFRIPEVLAASGATLVEVGTTNRTRLADYTAAVGPDTALILVVHPSNYRITGFTQTVGVDALAGVGVPVVADIGSGLLDARCGWLPDGPPAWLADEPAARQTLAAGAGLVTFSGDKLLGGPQSGIIAGSADLVDRCRRHPLARALRPGGLVLAEAQRTALAYLAGDATVLPLWAMATVSVADLAERAGKVAAACGGTVVDTEAVAGGGSLPGRAIPSVGVRLPGDRSAALRRSEPPVLARVRDGATTADLRSVDPADDETLGNALAASAHG
ncbi:MAG: L-seryl-tRNA(Sec) selenium transferase [Actinomycetota bacterium]|nr:L-seryl-tRNA(Sec) selenium transferase [Actinomycetota bacterium]